jgi:hypothetical protein
MMNDTTEPEASATPFARGDTFVNGGIAAQNHIADPESSAAAWSNPADALRTPQTVVDATQAALDLNQQSLDRDRAARTGEHGSQPSDWGYQGSHGIASGNTSPTADGSTGPLTSQDGV